jgi:hypothetical protein
VSRRSYAGCDRGYTRFNAEVSPLEGGVAAKLYRSFNNDAEVEVLLKWVTLLRNPPSVAECKFESASQSSTQEQESRSVCRLLPFCHGHLWADWGSNLVVAHRVGKVNAGLNTEVNLGAPPGHVTCVPSEQLLVGLAVQRPRISDTLEDCSFQFTREKGMGSVISSTHSWRGKSSYDSKSRIRMTVCHRSMEKDHLSHCSHQPTIYR